MCELKKQFRVCVELHFPSKLKICTNDKTGFQHFERKCPYLVAIIQHLSNLALFDTTFFISLSQTPDFFNKLSFPLGSQKIGFRKEISVDENVPGRKMHSARI